MKMQGGNFFCTLDIYKAYLHLPVDTDSQKIQTISTHRGSYLVKRLFFGIKTAPNEFHKFMDQFLHGLEGTAAYFNDIIIQGKSQDECYTRLIKVLDKLKAYNLHVNIKKCKFFEPKIEYLGHTISKDGLHKSQAKIEAIINTSPPSNIEETRQFLGFINYYSKFIPNRSEILHPLNQLLCKNKQFKWTQKCQEAFIKIKEQIASEQVLTQYNPDYPILLATDASPYGLSGVLSHKMPNGDERPIAFISRSLTKAERGYSQLDKEATAVYWACKQFFEFIYGRKITMIVDNKPMMEILNPNKKLPPLTAARLLRYAQFLSGLNYNIVHRKSENHANADYLSRKPIPINYTDSNILDVSYILQNEIINNIRSETITTEDIRRETLNDKLLLQLKNDIKTGKLFDPEITIQNDILLRGSRVIIPKPLQKFILQELHSTHPGIVKMKALARNHCFWKGIDADIEKLVKSCRTCCDVKKNPVQTTTHIWEPPSKNWERIHMDYAGPFMGHNFFLVIDAKSKWPEIFVDNQSSTSNSTIHHLEELFSRYGYPEYLISDNAKIFKSVEFTNFCKERGIIQKFSAPGHPATNGQVERYCQTLKQKLKCVQEERGTIKEKVQNILFRYRCTPLADGETPAEKMIGRKLRNKLDLLRPEKKKHVTFQLPVPQTRFVMEGERVQSRNYGENCAWKYGTVVKRLGQLHYIIRLDNGYKLKRHINQLRKCGVKSELESTYIDPFLFQSRNPPKQVGENVPVPGNNLPVLSRNGNHSNIEKEAIKARNLSVPAQPVRRSNRISKPCKRLNL